MSKSVSQELTYDAFAAVLKQISFIQNEPLAVAVSGGSDSMALLYLLSEWSTSFHHPIHVITIDHGLRPDSKKEVLWVADRAKELGFKPHIHHLSLEGGASVQERARHARYKAFSDICSSIGCSKLFLAHHGDDQMETFFLRLVAGSGVDGLSGMSFEEAYQNLSLFRPLLSFEKQALITFLEERSIDWIEDPSNQKSDFTRVRIRDFLSKEGFSFERMSRLTSRLSRASMALDLMVDKACEDLIRTDWGGVEYPLDRYCLEPVETQIRLLERLIRRVRGRGLSLVKLSSLESIVEQKKPCKTLHGCLIEFDYKANVVRVNREPLTCALTMIDDDVFDWENRFTIRGAKGFFIRSYQEADAPIIKKFSHSTLSNVPALYRLGLPVICDDEGCVKASLFSDNGTGIKITPK